MITKIAPAEAVKTLPNRQSQSDRRVLVVDDNEQNRTLLKFVLKGIGMSVIEAHDGKEAIDLACTEHPDIILMDLSMPVLDGFEATRQLKTMTVTQDIPIIAVSAFCSDPIKHEKALMAGCIACIDKPIRVDKIRAVLKAM